MKEVVVVVHSGGQDSTTCLAMILHLATDNQEILAVTFDYGQRHRSELGAAASVVREAERLFNRKIVREEINVQGVLKGTSPLVNTGTAVERYESAETLPGGLEKTFVPMRNTLFLTLAANRGVAMALDVGAERVTLVTGVSQEDYGGYPDCRSSFIDALTATFASSLDDPGLPKLRMSTPLMNINKAETVNLSENIPGARAMLALSHTCYNGEIPPCGSCHACLLRAKGYAEAGVTDPLIERLSMIGAAP